MTAFNFHGLRAFLRFILFALFIFRRKCSLEDTVENRGYLLRPPPLCFGPPGVRDWRTHVTPYDMPKSRQFTRLPVSNPPKRGNRHHCLLRYDIRHIRVHIRLSRNWVAGGGYPMVGTAVPGTKWNRTVPGLPRGTAGILTPATRLPGITTHASHTQGYPGPDFSTHAVRQDLGLGYYLCHTRALLCALLPGSTRVENTATSESSLQFADTGSTGIMRCYQILPRPACVAQSRAQTLKTDFRIL